MGNKNYQPKNVKRKELLINFTKINTPKFCSHPWHLPLTSHIQSSDPFRSISKFYSKFNSCLSSPPLFLWFKLPSFLVWIFTIAFLIDWKLLSTSALVLFQSFLNTATRMFLLKNVTWFIRKIMTLINSKMNILSKIFNWWGNH